jgi:hypothetical protein
VTFYGTSTGRSTSSRGAAAGCRCQHSRTTTHSNTHNRHNSPARAPALNPQCRSWLIWFLCTALVKGAQN